MSHIVVLKPFKFAHSGYRVEEFKPSEEPRETTDECAAIAIREGWAIEPGQKARAAAPENKDGAARRSIKHKTSGQVEAFGTDGSADDHPDAVAYAEQQASTDKDPTP